MGQSKPHSPLAIGHCPICRKPSDIANRPFCSKRCADVDLARWLGDGYVIPGGAGDADEDGDDALAGRLPADRGKGSDDEDV